MTSNGDKKLASDLGMTQPELRIIALRQARDHALTSADRALDAGDIRAYDLHMDAWAQDQAELQRIATDRINARPVPSPNLARAHALGLSMIDKAMGLPPVSGDDGSPVMLEEPEPEFLELDGPATEQGREWPAHDDDDARREQGRRMGIYREDQP